MPNQERTAWITYNGEVYNFRDHRSTLASQGYRFRSSTDTEVILALYDKYAERCVEHLRGMFAFAIWDRKKRRLLLARDRFGVKPLYFHHTLDAFLFSSELGPLRHSRLVSSEINYASLDAYLTLGYVPSPATIFKDVCKLQPGHTLIVDFSNNRIHAHEPRPYFHLLPRPNHNRSEAHTIERTRVLLEESIRSRLVADVPVGAFLSGGLDSSAIVAVMSAVFQHPVKTFSIGFSDPHYNELPLARVVARRFGTDHHELQVTPEMLLAAINRIIDHLGEPLGDASAVNSYFVSQLAREHVTVALCGDGGDEAFGGYDRYARDRWLDRLAHVPGFIRSGLHRAALALPARIDTPLVHLRRLRNILHRLALSPERRYLERMFVFDIAERRHLYEQDTFEQVRNSDPIRHWATVARQFWTDDLTIMRQFLDIQSYVPEDLMFKADRMSMCHSLEVREPLLDHKLLEHAMTIPSSMNLNRAGGRKLILKRAVADLVPQEVMDRPKRGFTLPYGDWLRGPLRRTVHETLLAPDAWIRRFLRADYVDGLIVAHEQKRFGTEWRLWNLLALELWARLYAQD